MFSHATPLAPTLMPKRWRDRRASGETLQQVFEWVAANLQTPAPFTLFTHPLRKEVGPDLTATLEAAELVPAALVNFRDLDVTPALYSPCPLP